MSETGRFEEFLRAHQDMVFATAFRIVGNPADAEDIAQEVFMKAFDRFEDLSEDPRAGGWLRTVARNQAINHLSRYRRRWSFFSEFRRKQDGGDTETSSFEASLAAPAETLPAGAAIDEKNLLEEALRALPDNQRIPLVLFHYEDMPYPEIARQLRVSLSKVKTDIARGRHTLRIKLQALLPEFGLPGDQSR